MSQELSRTKTRILGALSELNEFLLNPHVRRQSGTIPGGNQNTDVENQESNENRYHDLRPEVRSSVYRSITQLIQTQMGLLTKLREFKKGFSITPLGRLQEKKRRRAPQVSHICELKTTLRQLKQTRFFWPFNNSWQAIATPPISTTRSIEIFNCPSPSLTQCPHLTPKQRNLNCWKIYCKQGSKSTTGWQEKTK